MATRSITLYRQAHGLTLAALGARLGVQAAAVHKWEAGRVPAERVLQVERETGIPRSDLRPDLYEAVAAE